MPAGGKSDSELSSLTDEEERQMLEARERAGPLPALQIAEELRVVFEHLAQDDCTPLLSLAEAADLARQSAVVDADVQPHGSAGLTLTLDQEEAIESIRRLKAIAKEKNYRLIPGHDPDVWPAFTAELGCEGPHEHGRFLPV